MFTKPQLFNLIITLFISLAIAFRTEMGAYLLKIPVYMHISFGIILITGLIFIILSSLFRHNVISLAKKEQAATIGFTTSNELNTVDYPFENDWLDLN